MEPTRVFELLNRQLEKFPHSDALAAKEKGVWKTYSTQDFVNTVDLLASGLVNAGLGKEDKIGIIANNRPEWNFADYAIQKIAAISVPIYPTITEHDLAFILKDAEVKLVFVSSKELFEKVMKVTAQINPQIKIFSF